MNKKTEIAICLDEIDAVNNHLSKSKSKTKTMNKKQMSELKSWSRKQKGRLKELEYKGKIPRQPNITSIKIVEGE